MINVINNIDCETSEEVITKFECLKYLPTSILIKDLDSRFLVTTKQFANVCGWDTAEQAVGLKGYDIPSPISEMTDIFESQDKETLKSGDKYLFLNLGHCADGWRVKLWSKYSLKNKNGKALGTYGQGTDITNFSEIIHFNELSQFDQRRFGGRGSMSYNLNPTHSPLPSLTKRQQAVVFLLIRGKVMREISDILKISIRTVEDHINSIKNRLNCHSKGQIIEQAINAGFLYYIPEEFLNFYTGGY